MHFARETRLSGNDTVQTTALHNVIQNKISSGLNEKSPFCQTQNNPHWSLPFWGIWHGLTVHSNFTRGRQSPVEFRIVKSSKRCPTEKRNVAGTFQPISKRTAIASARCQNCFLNRGLYQDRLKAYVHWALVGGIQKGDRLPFFRGQKLAIRRKAIST